MVVGHTMFYVIHGICCTSSFACEEFISKFLVVSVQKCDSYDLALWQYYFEGGFPVIPYHSWIYVHQADVLSQVVHIYLEKILRILSLWQLFLIFTGIFLFIIEFTYSEMDHMWYFSIQDCRSLTNWYNLSFHDATSFTLKVTLVLGRKYGVASYSSTMEQFFQFKYRASHSIPSTCGHKMAVCDIICGKYHWYWNLLIWCPRTWRNRWGNISVNISSEQWSRRKSGEIAYWKFLPFYRRTTRAQSIVHSMVLIQPYWRWNISNVDSISGQITKLIMIHLCSMPYK